MDRRSFLLSSSSALTLAACSSADTALSPHATQEFSPFAASATFTRIEINEFSQNEALVAAFRKAIAAMRSVTQPRNVLGYEFWHKSHWMAHGSPPFAMQTVWNQCRHKVSYFFAWHRGFLVYFERVLRQASGNPKFALPYWDYYKNPNLPAIFVDPKLPDGSANPLYWPKRASKTVVGLSFAPFAPTVVEFPFGAGETYEDLVERNPHGHVHDQVGGSMGSVPTAPADPIFWLHHCNIDRYWTAWVAAGGNRKMPPPDSLWWERLFFYNVSRSWGASVRKMNDTKNFGYIYDNVSLPKAPAGATLPLRPNVVMTASAQTAGPLTLRLQPVTIEIPVDERMLRSPSLKLEIDDAALTEKGLAGGYTFGVYVNLPQTPVSLSHETAFSAGNLGPFELTMPTMGPMAHFPIGRALARQRDMHYAAKPKSLLVSFVPFGRPEGLSPATDLIHLGRLTLSS